MIKESLAPTEGDDTSVDQSRRNFLKHMVGGVVLATAGISAESKEGKVAEGSPFDPEVQKDALQFVAQKMNVVVEGGGPNVVVSESISDEDLISSLALMQEESVRIFFIPQIPFT